MRAELTYRGDGMYQLDVTGRGGTYFSDLLELDGERPESGATGRLLKAGYRSVGEWRQTDIGWEADVRNEPGS